MMDATMMKNFYDECSDMYNKSEAKKGKDNKESKILKIIENIYYMIKLRQMAKKLELEKYFEKNKDICSGKVVIKNTRIRPEIVVDYILSNTKNEKDMDSILKKTKKNYPALNDKLILCSLLYCMKGIKVKIK